MKRKIYSELLKWKKENKIISLFIIKPAIIDYEQPTSETEENTDL